MAAVERKVCDSGAFHGVIIYYIIAAVAVAIANENGMDGGDIREDGVGSVVWKERDGYLITTPGIKL